MNLMSCDSARLLLHSGDVDGLATADIVDRDASEAEVAHVRSHIRNVAVIAHVDHGKTTLVDAILAQTGTLRHGVIGRGKGQTGAPDSASSGGGGGSGGSARPGMTPDLACILDSNPLERERGITIFSKNCAIEYRPNVAAAVARRQADSGGGAVSNEALDQHEVFRINLIDTPGHADFGGEVERVLRMADGALLLVDAFEGPMPQTQFVLTKALELGLKLIVVINKCDRPDARPDDVVTEVFDLLVSLGASDEVLDFTTVFASGRTGWASREWPFDPNALTGPAAATPITPLLDAIIEQVPPPSGDVNAALQLLITTIDYSDYVGRIAIGRVFSGAIKSGQPVAICGASPTPRNARALRVMAFEGLGRRPTDIVFAGDLCAVEGIGEFTIGDTIADPDSPRPLPRVAVDEPTLHMVFRINDSPLGGREGEYVTSGQIGDRLRREKLSNIALRVQPGQSADEFVVSGRGLLHLGVLIENMRREGYELSVGRPEVIEKEIDGELCEPIERLTVNVSADAMGSAINLIGSRGGDIQNIDHRGERIIIECVMTARSLIGLRSAMLTATGGEAILYHSFLKYAPVRSARRKRQNGVMIATEGGRVTSYALINLADRGVMFVTPGDDVYEGQVVGEHNRESDLPVNVSRLKQLSNVRESNKEATVTLKAPRLLSIESALEYIEDDELVEVTPTTVRVRKRLLRESDRKREERRSKDRERGM